MPEFEERLALFTLSPFFATCCKGNDNKEVLFAKFYNDDGKTVDIATLTHFFESLKTDKEESLVKDIQEPADADSAPKDTELPTEDVGSQTEDSTTIVEE